MTKYNDEFIRELAESGPLYKNPKLRKKYNKVWNQEKVGKMDGKKSPMKTKIVRTEQHSAEKYLKALKRYNQSRSHRKGK
jgi:hypothetical protein